MSLPKGPKPALLVIPVLSSVWQDSWPQLKPRLQGCFGPVFDFGRSLRFGYSQYYDQEMGTPLYRRLLYAQDLYPQARLATAKLLTNGLEREFADRHGRRRINLDPGLLTAERLVLATGKESGHRIYLGQGIWGDLTLIYRHGSWQTLDWTFPDYADRPLQSWLTELRSYYKQRLKRLS